MLTGALSPVSISWTRSREGGNLFGNRSINTSLYSLSVLCTLESSTCGTEFASDTDFDSDFCSDSCSTFRIKYSTASVPGCSIAFKAPLSEMVLHPNSGSPSILPKRRGYGTNQYRFPSLVISIIILSQCVNALYCLCQFRPRTKSNSASKSITIASTCPCHPDIWTGNVHFPYTVIFWPPASVTCLSTSNLSIGPPAF